MTSLESSSVAHDTTDEGREVELKLGLRKSAAKKFGALSVVRDRMEGPPEVTRLETVYYDTPALDLFHAGVFLRVRRKGDRFVQALKTRGETISGIEDRRETEIELDGRNVRPDLVVDPPDILKRKSVRKRLAPAVTTTFSRKTWMLNDGNGTRIELAFDNGCIEAGGRFAPISEIELELKQGAPASLFDFSLALLDGVPLRSGDASKAVRGFNLIEPSPPVPVKSDRVRLNADKSADDAFQAIARSCLAQILANEAAVADGRDPEGVHQMRVGVRRLRSAMAVFEKMLSGTETASIAKDLKWFLGRLGPARDMDVFLTEILAPPAKYFAGDAGLAALARLAERWKAKEYRRVRALLRSRRYTRLLLRLGRWIERRGWRAGASKSARRAGGRNIALHAAAVLSKRHARLRDAGRNIESLSTPDLHRLRIQVKKQRYAAEFFGSLFEGPATARYVQALKSLQNSLGYLNDAAVAERLVDDLIANAPKKGGKTRRARKGGDLLRGWHGSEVANHRPELFDSWHQFGRHKNFWK